MQNAHLRLARLEYQRTSTKTQTSVAVHVSHFIGEREQAHLLSFFGHDAEVGAVTAAIQENHRFDLYMADGVKHRIGFGTEASVYKSNLTLSSQKRSLRHVVAVSAWLHANGSAGRTFLLNSEEEADAASWATVVGLQGLPAHPSWGRQILSRLRNEGKMKPLSGVGCTPSVIEATREEWMDRIGSARRSGLTEFPTSNGPLSWPSNNLRERLIDAGQ